MPDPAADLLSDRLDALERASDDRRAELQRLAAEIPAAVSRRSVVTAVVRDVRLAPDKAMIARRAFRKLLRGPAALVRRVSKRS
jgi:hypothetical protein